MVIIYGNRSSGVADDGSNCKSQVINIKNQEYVLAAQAMGVPNIRLFTKHIFPNILGPIAVYATLTIPQVMLLEAF